ncbi:TPA: helix-turn-helix domain-containing protein [Listeria monocytogenes]|nr:helix-turn-helix domain-containing protein [Listeria monocytogenes]HBI6388919.1 helix-turn-helix domain-containing protein [Listeria monocytogenes]
MIPDELAKLFLSRTQLQKLKILNKLTSGITTFSSLEEQLGMSKRKLKEDTTSLLREIEEIKTEHSYTLLVDKESIQFSKKLEDSEFVALTNSIREKYLSESSLFQVLLFVLEKRYFSISTMANELSYSESYAYKLYSKLNNFLYSMNADIRLTKKSDVLIQLTGNESTIRLIHYLSISIASKGNYWLFKTITQKEIVTIQSYINSRRYDRLSSVGKNRVNSILAVYELALKNGYKLSRLDDEVVILGEVINKEKEIRLYLKYLKKETENKEIELHEELIHLAFVINYFTQEIRSDEEKQDIGKHLCSMKSNTIVNKCLGLLDTITKRYPLVEESYYLLLYSLCNRLVVIHYLGLYNFMPLYKVPPLLGEIESFVENCIDKSLDSYRKDPSFDKLKYSMTKIITGYLIMIFPIRKKVYVEFFHRPEYKSIIENAIKYNYNQKVLQITNNYVESDIIISDTHGYDRKKFFYFNDVFDQSSWEKLGLYLNHIISNEIIEMN